MDLDVVDQEREMENLSAKLSQKVAIVFTEEEVEQARAELGYTLAVRLVGEKGFNKQILKEVLRQSWRVQGGLRFVEVENDTLLAKFNREEELERMLHSGPWRFMGRAVMVEKWESGRSVDEQFSYKLQIWVQIHNLPVEFRKEKYATKFAEKVGDIIKCGGRGGGKSGGDERGVYVRFLVEIDLKKPVVPGWELELPN